MIPRIPGRFPRWALFLVLATPFARADDALSDADKAAGKFINLQIETARLETDWRSQREFLETMISAANERAASLEEKRDLTKARTAKERAEFDALAAKNRQAHEELKAYEIRLAALTEKLLALRPALPPHLAEALEMTYRSLSNPTLSAGERTQRAMNLLNRCGQFNRVVTVGQGVLSLEGEPPEKSFETIYWGLSHGYALDRASHKAWLGQPGSGGWRWQAQPEAFDRVAQLIAIARDQADPAFVPVPALVTRALPSPR